MLRHPNQVEWVAPAALPTIRRRSLITGATNCTRFGVFARRLPKLEFTNLQNVSQGKDKGQSSLTPWFKIRTSKRLIIKTYKEYSIGTLTQHIIIWRVYWSLSCEFSIKLTNIFITSLQNRVRTQSIIDNYRFQKNNNNFGSSPHKPSLCTWSFLGRLGQVNTALEIMARQRVVQKGSSCFLSTRWSNHGRATSSC